ncbi:recQ-mediated genome instability protein 1 [Diospyros lotus]|uniref:recQ-mediated genome instability protein 1 n=1 Tax=Diospyros lotus TaxID=55363 RepID=UPI002257C0D8|nr:recQ-mediated genome instability protein 1 [Diospyros lotus]
MTRRRLRLRYSSSSEEDEADQRRRPQPEQRQQPLELDDHDEEIEEDDIEVELQDSTLNFRTITLNPPNPNPNPNTNPSALVQLEVSDDDDVFIDVPENLSPPSPNPPPPPPPVAEEDRSFQASFTPRTSSSNSSQASDCPISVYIGRLGLRLRREWLDSCIRGLESLVPGFGSLDVAGKAKLCFGQFLCSDMNFSGAGSLPENVHSMHLIDLAGPFVLQVDEIVNISCPLKGRYQNASAGLKRCLKLSMTDGVQRVFGMEYRPIKDLDVLAPAGLKVAICNVNIRRGLLMLVPEVFEVLGGAVEDLEAARQRLVHEVNKPPRGKRTRTGVVPPLATRATLGAWPPDNVSTAGQDSNPLPQTTAPRQAAEEDRTSGISTREGAREEFSIPVNRENAEPNPSPPVPDVDEIHMVNVVDHPFILSGDREVPFTYLASLSAKWAAVKDKAPSVQGKVKCFLTGVKGFQYKNRTTFDLCVYVDDGSLISEILIDHNVVQRGIGHSPEEVTAALASSDPNRVRDMKGTLKQFQIFLANFEGTMLVKISEASPLPIAIEMNQGFPSSDAWLLLRRIQSANTAQPQHIAEPQQDPHLDPIPIDLSP